LKPEPEITSPNLTFMFKARFSPKAKPNVPSGKDVRKCEASVA